MHVLKYFIRMKLELYAALLLCTFQLQVQVQRHIKVARRPYVAYPSARGMRIVATQRTIEGHETSHCHCCRSLHKSAPRNTSPRRVSLFYDVSVVNDFAVALRSIRSALCRNSVNRNAVVVGALRECIAGSHLMSYRLSISTVQTPAVV